MSFFKIINFTSKIYLEPHKKPINIEEIIIFYKMSAGHRLSTWAQYKWRFIICIFTFLHSVTTQVSSFVGCCVVSKVATLVSTLVSNAESSSPLSLYFFLQTDNICISPKPGISNQLLSSSPRHRFSTFPHTLQSHFRFLFFFALIMFNTIYRQLDPYSEVYRT